MQRSTRDLTVISVFLSHKRPSLLQSARWIEYATRFELDDSMWSLARAVPVWNRLIEFPNCEKVKGPKGMRKRFRIKPRNKEFIYANLARGFERRVTWCKILLDCLSRVLEIFTQFLRRLTFFENSSICCVLQLLKCYIFLLVLYIFKKFK